MKSLAYRSRSVSPKKLKAKCQVDKYIRDRRSLVYTDTEILMGFSGSFEKKHRLIFYILTNYRHAFLFF